MDCDVKSHVATDAEIEEDRMKIAMSLAQENEASYTHPLSSHSEWESMDDDE